MILNPYRYSAAGGIPTPLHFWDLDDTGTGTGAGLDDQGNHSTDMTLQTNGTILTEANAPDGGNALKFDSNGDYLDTSSDIAWDSASDDMSCSIWYNADLAATTFNSLVTWRQAGAPFGWQLLVVNSSPDYVTATLWDDSATVGSAAATKAVAEDTAETSALNTWYHAVMTFKSSTGTLKLYIDTVEIAEEVDAGVDAFNPNAMPFAIGAGSFNKASTSFQHRGNVWSCGIWDTVLTPAQISELNNSGTGGKYADYTWT